MYLDTPPPRTGAGSQQIQGRREGRVRAASKGTKYSTETGGSELPSPQLPEKEAAYLLLQWLTSKATDRKITKFGAMPNRLSTLKDPAMQKEYRNSVRCLKT